MLPFRVCLVIVFAHNDMCSNSFAHVRFLGQLVGIEFRWYISLPTHVFGVCDTLFYRSGGRLVLMYQDRYP